MKIDFVPKTASGRWAVGFAILLVALAILSLVFAAAIGGDPAVIADSALLSMLANILSVMFTLAGPISFFIGIFTIIKYKEWSIYKPLVALYILTVLIFLLGEFLFSH